MRRATREALDALVEAADATAEVDVDDARSLLGAARALEATPQILAALVDARGDRASRVALVQRVFATLDARVVGLLTVAVEQRWSSSADLLAGLEEAGIRLAARASDGDVVGELHRIGAIVESDAELELALSGRLGDPADKARVVARLFEGRAADATIVILDHLVRSPRGRRIGGLVRDAIEAAARAAGESTATVTTANALSDAQLSRLEAGLAARYGRRLRVQQRVDPQIIGGLRVAVADDVIDGTIRSKFTDLRLQLG